MNQKRRVIYIEDHVWEALKSESEINGVSISRIIRDALQSQRTPKKLPGKGREKLT
ncbi:MAG TPA: hypothetical protein VIX18_01075 [Nitrospirota bacterium]